MTEQQYFEQQEYTHKDKEQPTDIVSINMTREKFNKMDMLGFFDNNVRSSNVGGSNYSTKIIQSWSIWIEYNLNPFEADIIKRILRTKKNSTKLEDYYKIEHIIKELIRQEELKNEHQENSKILF